MKVRGRIIHPTENRVCKITNVVGLIFPNWGKKTKLVFGRKKTLEEKKFWTNLKLVICGNFLNPKLNFEILQIIREILSVGIFYTKKTGFGNFDKILKTF